MNQNQHNQFKQHMIHMQNSEKLMDQFGRRMASRLDVSAKELSHDVSERLRVARMRAVAAKRSNVWQAETAGALNVQGASASLSLGQLEGGVWNTIASFLPIAVLIIGIFVLFNFHDRKITHELAEVDAKLLLDDLPPIAYTDPGFLKFLQTTNFQRNGDEVDSGASTDQDSSESGESASSR